MTPRSGGGGEPISSSPAQATFAEVFGEALRQRSMSLSHLRDRLAGRGHQVSLATLSYWRSGQREPERIASLEALPVIEELLGLSDGVLSRAVASGVRRGRVKPFNELLPVPTDEMMRSEWELTRVASHLTVDINAAGELDHLRHRWVVVAERGEVAGMTTFIRPGVGREALVSAVAGCVIEQIEGSADGIWRYFARFDRPLRMGESTAFEVQIEMSEPELDTTYSLIAEERQEEAMIWVRFHPDKVPSRCWVNLSEGDLAHTWPVDLGGGHTLHQRQTAFGPGRLGVNWEW